MPTATVFFVLGFLTISLAAQATELRCMLKEGTAGDYAKISTAAGKINSMDIVTEQTKTIFSVSQGIYGGFVAGNCYMNDNSFQDSTDAGEVYAACEGFDVPDDVTFDLILLANHSGRARMELTNPTGTEEEWQIDLVDCHNL